MNKKERDKVIERKILGAFEESEELLRRNRQGGTKKSRRGRQNRKKREENGLKMSKRPRRAKRFLLKLNRRHPWIKMVVMLLILVGLGVGITILQVSIEEGRKQEKVEVVDEGQTENEGSETGEDGTNDEEDGEGEEMEKEAKDEVAKKDGKEVKTQVNNDLIPAAETEGKMLAALTFDDGPSNETTGRLLDILKEKQVRVTFFVLGTMTQAYPDLVQRQLREGHEVGTHSMRHANLGVMGWDAVGADLAEAKGVLASVTGVEPTLFRPPYGSINEAVLGMGMPVITWAVDPNDWRDKDFNTVQWRVCEYTFDGAIVLMHDIYNSTVDAVPGIIDTLRGKGYELVTVSELAAAKGVSLDAGVVYGKF